MGPGLVRRFCALAAAAVAHTLSPYVAPETFVAVTIDTSLRRLPRAGQ